MADRYIRVYKSDAKLYMEGSPLVISACALLKDTVTEKVLTQIKFQNISEKIITACRVTVKAFAVDGTELDGVPDFTYLDEVAEPGSDFGSKTPIYLPDQNTRRIEVSVTNVGYEDGEYWSAPFFEWVQIPDQQRIADYFSDNELVKQYGLEVGGDCEFVPAIQNGLFQCTCGTMNPSASSKCYKCGRDADLLIESLDENSLTEKMNQRLQKEAEAKKAEEEAAARAAEEEQKRNEIRQEKNRKRKKIIFITTPFIVIAIVIAALFPGTIKPAIDNARAYKSAEKLLEEDSFDEAKAAFEALGEYKDSAEKAKQAVYEKAEVFYSEGDYSQAIKTWNSISDYSDSENRSKAAKDEWDESEYQKALSLIDEKMYLKAANILSGISGYKDSKDKYTECKYQLAVQAIDVKEYKTAIDNLVSIISYKDSSELYKQVSYYYAIELTAANDFENAYSYFMKAEDYNDAAERGLDALYNYACSLLKNNDYRNAIDEFKKCGDYKESVSKILEAKYAYVTEHKTRSDSVTYEYLLELIDSGFSEAQAVYNDLFEWHLQLLAINYSETDLKTNYDTLSKYNTWYFHFQLSGGPPDASEGIQLYYSIFFPNGNTIGPSPIEGGISYSGGNPFIYAYYTNPEYGSSGTCTVYIYDENNNEMASASVMITN